MQMLYFEPNEIKLPLLLAIAMVLLLPLLIILSILATILCFVVMIPVGFVMGLGTAIIKFIHLCCLVILILPIAGAVGAIVFPFYFTFWHILPNFIHHFRRYKITVQ
jgi:hypothetical protein